MQDFVGLNEKPHSKAGISTNISPYLTNGAREITVTNDGDHYDFVAR